MAHGFSDLMDTPRATAGTLCAIGNFGVSCAAGIIAHKRDDFAIGVNSPAVCEDVVDRQWTILHSAEHFYLLVYDKGIDTIQMRQLDYLKDVWLEQPSRVIGHWGARHKVTKTRRFTKISLCSFES